MMRMLLPIATKNTMFKQVLKQTGGCSGLRVSGRCQRQPGERPLVAAPESRTHSGEPRFRVGRTRRDPYAVISVYVCNINTVFIYIYRERERAHIRYIFNYYPHEAALLVGTLEVYRGPL